MKYVFVQQVTSTHPSHASHPVKPESFPVSPSSRASISTTHRACNADNAAITRLWLGPTGSVGGQAVGDDVGRTPKPGLADALSVCCEVGGVCPSRSA